MNLSAGWHPVCIMASALAGLALGYFTVFGAFSAHFIEPFLMVLLYFVFLSVDGGKFKESFRDVKFTGTSLGINFVWTPLFSYVLGLVFFYDSLDLRIGLVMLMVTPCTDWYLVFTGLAKGNVELGASILPLNLLLQILLLPVYLFLFFGGSIHFGQWQVLLSIAFVLVIPWSLAALTRWMGRRCASWRRRVDQWKEWGDRGQMIFLCLAVIAMFGSESQAVFDNLSLLLQMMIPLVLFFAINFIGAWRVGRWEQFPDRDITALIFTTMARNSPLSLAIAAVAFPDRPLISLALVIGPLIELPVLGAAVHVIQRTRQE